MKAYPVADDLVRPVLGVALPRPPRLVAPGGTVYVVARCDNRGCPFTSAADFAMLLATLSGKRKTVPDTN